MKTRTIIENAERFDTLAGAFGLIADLARKVAELESREEARHRIQPILQGKKPSVGPWTRRRRPVSP